MANKPFLEYFNVNFSFFIVVYTDSSVSLHSAGYSFFIPKLYIIFNNNLPTSSFSFTVECYVIIKSLVLISIFPQTNF